MVDKITTPPTNNEVIDKINEVVDNLVIPYGESTSAADATQKEVTISSITSLSEGQIIIVKPTITSTVADSTLKLNSFTAYPMLYGAAAITTSTDSVVWSANYPSWFRFDGSNWVFLGHGLDNNTTYSTMSVAEGTTGTARSNRSLQARYLKQIIQGTTLTGLSTSTNSAVTASDTVTTGIGKLQAEVNNAVMKSATAQQTIALSSGTGTTALGVTSKSTSSYISFSGTGGWIGSYGVSSDKKPVFYNGTSYTLAYTSDIPTNNNQLTNGAGYITGISSSDVTTALGYTPYNSTNPNGYQANVIETVKVNGTTQTVTDKTVDISVPTADGTTISYNSNDALQTIAVKNKRDDSVLPIWQGSESQWINGEQLTWYNWRTTVTASWTTGGNASFSTSIGIHLTAYGNGVFLHIHSGNKANCYSTDGGATWLNGTNSNINGGNIIYCGDRFLKHSYSRSDYTFDNGLTWTRGGNIPISNAFYGAYGNGVIIVTTNNSEQTAYSLDKGETWVRGGDLPSSGSWNSIAYGDGVFVAAKGSDGETAYTLDYGKTWIQGGSLPSYTIIAGSRMAYGNGRFVIIHRHSGLYGSLPSCSYYSVDKGKTWVQGGDLSSQSSTQYSICYGDGIFLAVEDDYNATTSAYSIDGGESWTSINLAEKMRLIVPAYGNGTFVTFADSKTAAYIFTAQYDKCYTDTATPTTTSTVYSAPETTSALTVSSVTSGAITLSDNNTYYYNQSGNQYTYQTIGDAHPEYLCFIDGKGVKMGNNWIATNNSNS